jgi:hypothetical protein
MTHPTEKPCCKCGEIKPLSEYHIYRERPDGRQSQCKSCIRAYYASRKPKELLNRAISPLARESAAFWRLEARQIADALKTFSTDSFARQKSISKGRLFNQ